MVSRSHKIKLNPTKKQRMKLAQYAGTSRFTYNWGLNKWKSLYEAGEKVSGNVLAHLWILERPEWAREVSAQTLQRPFQNLEKAFKSFFKGITKYPKFHKKYVNDSFYITNQAGILLPNKKIYISKIGNIRMRQELRYENAKIMRFTIKREADGWYVIVNVQIEDEIRTNSTSFVGVDVGCATLAIASDGTVCKKAKKIKKLEKSLKHRQKALSRKQLKSHNRSKQRRKVAKVYQKIKRIKLDAIHKFTSNISKNHGYVCIESLDVNAMKESKNKSIRKGVQNSEMAEILRQLKYKCNHFIEVSKWIPSSKTCSNCGEIKQDLSLSERVYHCEKCGNTLDRDLNAAKNLCKEGFRIFTLGHKGSACGGIQWNLNEAGIPNSI